MEGRDGGWKEKLTVVQNQKGMLQRAMVEAELVKEREKKSCFLEGTAWMGKRMKS